MRCWATARGIHPPGRDPRQRGILYHSDKYLPGHQPHPDPGRSHPEKLQEVKGPCRKGLCRPGLPGPCPMRLFVETDGTVLVNEINTMPASPPSACIQNHGGGPAPAKLAGPAGAAGAAARGGAPWMRRAHRGYSTPGVGGSPPCQELQALLPRERLVYFGDTGRQPYGSRSPENHFAVRQAGHPLASKTVKLLLAPGGTISSALPPAYAATPARPMPACWDAAAWAAAQATRSGQVRSPARLPPSAAAPCLSGRAFCPARRWCPHLPQVGCPLVEKRRYVEPGDAVTATIARE